MHRRETLLLAVLAFVLVFASGPAALAATTLDARFDWDDVYVPGEPVRDGMLMPDRLLVTFAPTAIPQQLLKKGDGEIITGQLDLDRVAREIGAREMAPMFPGEPAPSGLNRAPDQYELSQFYSVRFDDSRISLAAAAQRMASVASVVLVEPDPIHNLHATLPNDPGLSQQWWLRGNYGDGDIRALAAWNNELGSPDVVMVSADSGVDWRHPDLGGTAPDYIDGVIWINEAELNGTPGIDDDQNGYTDDIRGWDFVTGISGAAQSPPQDVNVPDNDPMDYESHGTWVAGCMGAISDNGIGVAGINWNAKVMACRIGWLPAGQPGGVVSMGFAAQAMTYARGRGADVFNCSWGSSNITSLRLAVDAAVNAGMIIVSSAGNDDNDQASYLCSRSDVIAVAATGRSDSKAGFSSFGSWVDISAPGVAVYTTGFDRFGSNGSEHTYGAPQGTSFSSPIVAGAFGMAKSAFPNDTRQQLIDRVLAATDNIDAENSGYIGLLGSGRLNLVKLFGHGPVWKVPEELPTITDAMNTCEVGDTLAVAGSEVLDERLQLPSDKSMTILGAYDATYTTRDLQQLTTVSVSTGSGPVLRVNGVGSDVTFDGFSISGGRALFVSFEPTDGYYGGGILMRDSSAILRNIRVENSVAGLSGDFGAGGGIAILGGSPVLENVVVTGNSARRGAGLYVHRASPQFTNVEVTNNTSYTTLVGEAPLGGGVYLNGAPESGAGGVVSFDGLTVSGHGVEGDGGGIYAIDSSLRIENGLISGNTSKGTGAGIHVEGGALELVDSEVSGNAIDVAVTESGGGIYANGGALTVQGSRIAGNTARFSGGGIAAENVSLLDVNTSFIVDNTAGLFGTAMYVPVSPVGTTITSNTVAYNIGASSGGNGLFFGSGAATLTGNIVAFNGTQAGLGLPDGVQSSGATLTVSCNLVHGNASGNWGGLADPTGTDGNVDADPQFCDAEAGNYGIDDASPAAPSASSCGLIGAGAVDCTSTAISPPNDGTPNGKRVLALEQNAPNPFNPSTVIRFSLPQASEVELRVVDLRGRVVRVLGQGEYEAGAHELQWNGLDTAGRRVASGTYLYELRTDQRVLVRKMALLK